MSCGPPHVIRLVRCPECGSTKAGVDEARSVATLDWMQCDDCDHGEFANSHERFDWNVKSELIGDELPEYLKPHPARI